MITYTTAPASLDAPTTRTLRVIGQAGPHTVRLVESPDEDGQWQRYRYEDAGYIALADTEWPRVARMLGIEK